MKKRYWVVLIFSIILIGVLVILLNRDKFYFATDYSNLQLKIKTQSQTIAINPWMSEAGEMYYFLPSCVESAKNAKFNISTKSSVELENVSIAYKDDILDLMKYDTPLSLELFCEDFIGEKMTVYFCHSTTIPSVYVYTKNNDIEVVNADKSYVSYTGQIMIVDDNGEKLFSGKYDSIKGRGNSTFLWADKKAYKMSFKKSVSLLGMDDSSDWNFLANAFDGSSMRNKLVYDFANEYTSVIAPNSVYVDLYIDNDYCGNYQLTESVKSIFDKINVVGLEEKNVKLNSSYVLETNQQFVSEDGKLKAVENIKNPDDITGGYLIELSREFDTCRCGFITNNGSKFKIISPQNASVEQVEYIRNYINEIEDALKSEDGICSKTNKHYSDYIDVESWVDYYLLNEVFQDPDSSSASCYFYKQSDTVDPKVYAGPAWDYDLAIGGYVIIDDKSFNNPQKESNYFRYSDYLKNQAEIAQLIKERYTFLFSAQGKRSIESMISEYEKSLESSIIMDNFRWENNKYYYDTLGANIDYLLEFINKKTNYLEDTWIDDILYHRVSFLDYDGNICDDVLVRHGEHIEDIPSCYSYVALFKGWYSTKNGWKLTETTQIYEDEVYESRWIVLDPMVINMMAISECNIDDYDLDDLELVLTQIQKMKNDKNINLADE